MKLNYCSRCNLPSKKLYNCKYEECENDWFLLCTKCVLQCRKIFKKAFKSQSEKITSVGLVKTTKERSLL